MLEKTTWMNILYDRYGMLLSEKQQQYMQLYYLDDFSLGEIAEEVNVSRQAVYDQIRRAEAQLQLFEEKMQLIAKSKQRDQWYGELQDLLTELRESKDSKGKSEQGLQLLKLLRELD